MADLIDRDALKDYIENLWDMQDAYLPCHFFDAMDDMLTVDAKPIRRGHWIIFTDKSTFGKCSICGMAQRVGRLNYCPECGAKMDEEENK